MNRWVNYNSNPMSKHVGNCAIHTCCNHKPYMDSPIENVEYFKEGDKNYKR